MLRVTRDFCIERMLWSLARRFTQHSVKTKPCSAFKTHFQPRRWNRTGCIPNSWANRCCSSAACPATSTQRRLAGKHPMACAAGKKNISHLLHSFLERKKGGENKNLWIPFNVCINTPEVSSLFLPFTSQKYSRAALNSIPGVECFEKRLAVKISSLYKNDSWELNHWVAVLFLFYNQTFFVANKQDLSCK